MGLRERLSAPPADPARQFCTVGRTLDVLDPEDRAALVGAMQSGQWSSTDIVRAVTAENHDATVRHMREHRRGSHTVDQCRAPLDGVIQ
jgi:hypothetical protein